MKTYTVLFAEDVPHYGTASIEAPDDAAAIAAAKACDASTVTDDPDWSAIVCRRIVSIEDPNGEIIATDLSLDGYHLRNGGDADRRLCEVAPALLEALTRIAAIPLWGEPITAVVLRDDYVFSGEYALGEDEFTPSADTESTMLRDAVKHARAAIAALEGRGR